MPADQWADLMTFKSFDLIASVDDRDYLAFIEFIVLSQDPYRRCEDVVDQKKGDIKLARMMTTPTDNTG